jgi:hypothetical protein
MSGVSLTIKALDGVILTCRAGLAIYRTARILKKLDSEVEWRRSDYIEVAGNVGYVFCETMDGYKTWKVSNQNSISSQEERQENQELLTQALRLLAGCSAFIGDYASGKSFRKALLTSTLLGRGVGFLDRPLSFATHSMPVLQTSSQLVIKTTETAMVAYPITEIVRENWQILSNLLYLDARREIRKHNEKKPQEIPLTIPPKGEYPSLPEEYEKDPIFSKYECGICFKNIRYPACFVDGQTKHYYELSQIREWIQKSGINPATGLKVNLDDISIDLIAQREIENRMRHFQIDLVGK